MTCVFVSSDFLAWTEYIVHLFRRFFPLWSPAGVAAQRCLVFQSGVVTTSPVFFLCLLAFITGPSAVDRGLQVQRCVFFLLCQEPRVIGAFNYLLRAGFHFLGRGVLPIGHACFVALAHTTKRRTKKWGMGGNAV